MFKKIYRTTLPFAIALGLVLPFATDAQPDQPKAEKNSKAKTKGKGKDKSKGERRKAEEPKQQ